MKKIGVLFVIGFMIACDHLNAAAQQAIDYRPLLAAVEAGNVDEIKLFLEDNRDMDIETKDNYGYTPLHLASARGKINVVRILLERGANIEAKNNYCATPLISASSWGHTGCVELLLKRGANIEAKGHYGGTPLHHASVCGQKRCVELLLNWGADKEAKNNKGHTAAQIAKIYGYNDLAAFIESYQELPEIKEPEED